MILDPRSVTLLSLTEENKALPEIRYTFSLTDS